MIAIVLGTRPEVVKMSPIIRECERTNVSYFILHTGQHYSHNMNKIFFEELELPAPRHNLQVGSGTHAEETGKILTGVERILHSETPDIVLVEGDTNTVLGAALASAKLRIKLGHVEAGLRSHDRSMPEEINRVVADHIADYLFAPTEKSRQNLEREGIEGKNIFVTGNTIVDSVRQSLEIARRKADALARFDLEKQRYFLVTAHRAENVDKIDRLQGIVKGLELLQERFSLPVIYPAHPRTTKRMREFGLAPPRGTRIVEPLGYLEFLQLEENAKVVLTDSGGVQEETCVLGVPCVTVRDNTERPETLEVGSNILVGTLPQKILEGVEVMSNKRRDWRNPFGDGNAGRRIVEIARGSTS